MLLCQFDWFDAHLTHVTLHVLRDAMKRCWRVSQVHHQAVILKFGNLPHFLDLRLWCFLGTLRILVCRVLFAAVLLFAMQHRYQHDGRLFVRTLGTQVVYETVTPVLYQIRPACGLEEDHHWILLLVNVYVFLRLVPRGISFT